ncbi:hypothetical protein HHK36_017009 [Tetracentron sinense]|uniref:Pentatricopeptide repeat-containing protein n=1 Tax=Tetracentron sinense TaxID=13715 RepID=A0A835DC45_TETSI|nr:hypothetical protein HHK36_017009 [Tetracentron sinense]
MSLEMWLTFLWRWTVLGLNPGLSMIESDFSVLEDGGEGESDYVCEEDSKRRISYPVDDGECHQGGPSGYLAWKMMADGDYRGAVKLVLDFRKSGLKPEVYNYLIAMAAKLNEFSKALRKLKGFVKNGLVAELDVENIGSLPATSCYWIYGISTSYYSISTSYSSHHFP